MSDMKNIAAALVKAQRAFGPALKSATNPHFKSKYADLSACIEAVIDGLNDAGIALIQRQHPHDSGVCVETVFVHESGETLSAGMLTVPAAKQDPQGYGSALTYARRYSLMAACGIAPEDDDGNAASKPRAPAAPLAPPPQMDPGRLADMLATIGDTSDTEALRELMKQGMEAARQAADETAFRAIRTAATKRADALKATT